MAGEDNTEKGQNLFCQKIHLIPKLKKLTNKLMPKKPHSSLRLRGITSKFL
jgi:hypothetical protein